MIKKSCIKYDNGLIYILMELIQKYIWNVVLFAVIRPTRLTLFFLGMHLGNKYKIIFLLLMINARGIEPIV